jgi:type I restriction enzyme M protein
LGPDYPVDVPEDVRRKLGANSPLALWYQDNPADTDDFERLMRRRVHYVIRPEHLWTSIAEMARVQDNELLSTLQTGMKYIEEQSFEHVWRAVLRNQPVIGKAWQDLSRSQRRALQNHCRDCQGAETFSTGSDTLGDAYEYLIGQFAAGSAKSR